MINKYKQMTIDALESLFLTDKEALNELGERLFYKKEYQKSLEYFKKSAIFGNDMAINNLGFYYLEIENDFENAKKYFLDAMEKGNILAINNLGVLYDRNKNYKKAREYYLIAINKKCSFAYNNLGGLYENVYQKYEEAEKLYQRCFEETEDTDCLINLAYLYLNYYENKNGAIKYLKLAISKGNKEAEHVLFHVLNDEVCNCNND